MCFKGFWGLVMVRVVVVLLEAAVSVAGDLLLPRLSYL